MDLLREQEGVAAQVSDEPWGLSWKKFAKKYSTCLATALKGVRVLNGVAVKAAAKQAKAESVSLVNPKTPALDSFGRDLTELARQNKLDPVIGRSKEIERAIQILCRRTKNNPVLLG